MPACPPTKLTSPHPTSSHLAPTPCRYKHLVGREAVVPMSGGRRIKIIADEYVDREFGTGALKITPGGGMLASCGKPEMRWPGLCRLPCRIPCSFHTAV